MILSNIDGETNNERIVPNTEVSRQFWREYGVRKSSIVIIKNGSEI